MKELPKMPKVGDPGIEGIADAFIQETHVLRAYLARAMQLLNDAAYQRATKTSNWKLDINAFRAFLKEQGVSDE